MPIQQYQCRDCNQSFEHMTVVTRLSSSEEVKCPSCSSKSVDRLIGLPATARAADQPAANCRGDGPPCGAPWCGRKN